LLVDVETLSCTSTSCSPARTLVRRDGDVLDSDLNDLVDLEVGERHVDVADALWRADVVP
jgi:hypothetical protein